MASAQAEELSILGDRQVVFTQVGVVELAKPPAARVALHHPSHLVNGE